MHEQAEKPKAYKSRAAADAAVQKKSNMSQGYGIIDNRANAVAQRKLQVITKNSQPVSQQRFPHEMAEVNQEATQLKINSETFNQQLDFLSNAGARSVEKEFQNIEKNEATSSIASTSPVQLRIQAATYNAHIAALERAGSRRAGLTHPEHDEDSVPDRYGQGLVDEAQQDEEDARAVGNNALADAIRVAVRAAKNAFGFYR